MKNLKTHHVGKFLVALILVLGVVLALTTRHHYTTQRPASTEARLLDSRRVLATFPPEAHSLLRTGMKATISLDGKRHTGFLSDPDPDQAHTYVVALDPTPPAPATAAKCQVIVDTTVPPELLKSRPPPFGK